MIIRFPAYRRFSDARIEVNDAMMALLIGARLGEHALSTSAASKDALLPALFGDIPGIRRVNRTTSDAAQLLSQAELHLAYMAIPYALAIHSSFLVSAAAMVREAGLDSPSRALSIQYTQDLKRLPLRVAHEYVAERCSRPLDKTLLSLFHLARRIRNRIIHAGGTTGSRLRSEYDHLPSKARGSWEKLSGRPLPEAMKSGKLDLGEGELIAVLAISRNLAQEVNDLLAHSLGREYWATVVVKDYSDTHPQRFGEEARRPRRLRGYSQRFYGPLQISDTELEAAVKAAKG